MIRRAITIILLLVFFAGGFYLGYQSRGKEIRNLKVEAHRMQASLALAKKSFETKKIEMKQQMDVLKGEWKERKQDLDKLEEKIEETFEHFSAVFGFH